MIEEIIDSRAKIRIVRLFCEFPKKKFQIIDVAGACGLSNSRTSECLRELAEYDIFESRKIGKGYEYSLNLSNFFSKLLLKLFKQDRNLLDNIIKDFKKHIRKIREITSVVLFGSAMKELKIKSDIDFLIISKNKIERDRISKIETDLIEKYGFHISSTIMTEDELRRKSIKGEEFVTNIIANNKLVYGKNLEEIIWSEK